MDTVEKIRSIPVERKWCDAWQLEPLRAFFLPNDERKPWLEDLEEVYPDWFYAIFYHEFVMDAFDLHLIDIKGNVENSTVDLIFGS